MMGIKIGALAVTVLALAAGVPALTGGTPAAQAADAPAIERCGMGGLEVRGGVLAGGYRCAPAPYGPDVQAAARTLVASVDRLLPADRAGYEVISAAEQVVAGKNYQLVVAVTGKQPEILIGTVYRPLDGAMSVTSEYAIAHSAAPRKP